MIAQGNDRPLVAVIMGSKSDWKTMKLTGEILKKFAVPFEVAVVSAHRTPDRMAEYAKNARSRGIKVIIAAAGGAAHLPGMTAANTVLPVIGVPVAFPPLNGVDSLHSIVMMPRGVPVATMTIGEWGAVNAAHMAVRMLAMYNEDLVQAIEDFQVEQVQEVLKMHNDVQAELAAPKGVVGEG